MKVYQYIAIQLSKDEWAKETSCPDPDGLKEYRFGIEAWVRRNGPAGNGIDHGTVLQETSLSNRLVLSCSFHHPGELGWTRHHIIVVPDLALGIQLHITGHDRNRVKDHLERLFMEWLNTEVSSEGVKHD